MLLAQFLESFLYRPRLARLEFRISLPNAFDRFLIILAIPFERVGWLLPVPLGIIVQLGLAFGCEGHHIHRMFPAPVLKNLLSILPDFTDEFLRVFLCALRVSAVNSAFVIRKNR